MKVYVKKDKLIKLIGEGKTYSKKNLILREGISGFEPGAPNVSAAARDAATKLASNGNLSDVTGSADDVTQGNAASANGNIQDPTITTDVKSPQSIQQTQNILNRMNPSEKANVDVKFIDGAKQKNNNMENSSVISRETLDEMRENSIPFTKSELTEFLKSI